MSFVIGDMVECVSEGEKEREKGKKGKREKGKKGERGGKEGEGRSNMLSVPV